MSAFEATRWTLVRRAQGDSSASRQALSELCEAYWQPVFRFLCHDGKSRGEAEELTQAFFAKLLESGQLGGADPERGRFRSYVLGAVKHFLADLRKADKSQKRGGGQVPLSIEEVDPADPQAELDDALFDREWAFTVLDHALQNLEAEWQSQGRENHFSLLKPWLTGEGGAPNRESVADQLGLSASAFKVTVHRLRKRFRQQVREEIAQTVDATADIAAELGYLLEVVSR